MMDAVILWIHHGSGPGHEALREDYLRRSVELVKKFEERKVPLVSFTSMPHHREVVHTLLVLVCQKEEQKASCNDCRDPGQRCLPLQRLQDRHLFSFLKEGERSALFRPIYRGNPAWRLPREAPYDPRLVFFYLNTGPEIARVEMPFWIAETGLLPTVHAILMDQCRPRRAETVGYPLALTLAHREAVLTTRDRQFIQWQIEEALARRGIYLSPSPKAEMK